MSTIIRLLGEGQPPTISGIPIKTQHRNTRAQPSNQRRQQTKIYSLHQVVEVNKRLQTKVDAVEEHYQSVTATKTDNQKLRRQVKGMKNQHAGELKMYAIEKHAL